MLRQFLFLCSLPFQKSNIPRCLCILPSGPLRKSSGMLQEGGKSHQTLGGAERCRVRDGPRFGEGAEEQELGHPAAPWELLGRFPEPRLTSTGQLDHNSPALLLGTRNTGKLLPNGAKRNRALSPPKPTRCYQSSGHLWDLGPPASCPSRDGSVRELPAQDTGAPRLVFPLPSSQYIQGFFQCISPTAAFPSSRN